MADWTGNTMPPPPALTPRQQRRWIKDQQRAQERVLRAQREQQARLLRRRSLLGPVLLVLVGVLALALEFGRITWETVSVLYLRWWPLVVIGAGVFLLLEWLVDRSLAPSGVASVRRAPGGGLVFLLLVLAALTGLHPILHMDRNQFAWEFSNDSLRRFLGNQVQTDEDMDAAAVEPGARVEIEDPNGDVTVTGDATDGKMHVQVHKSVWSFSGDHQDQQIHELQPVLESTGGGLALKVPSQQNGHVDLQISLPASANLSINAGHGEMHVSGLRAPVQVISGGGDVEVRDVAGDVTARLDRRPSSFAASHITGSVTLRGNAHDVSLQEVAGPAVVEGEFFGDSHFERLPQGLNFHTGRTTLTVAQLPGTLDISPNADLSGDGLAGPVNLTTRSRNVTLDNVAGDVSVTNRNGPVTLTETLPGAHVTVENRDGEVAVTLPANAGFRLAESTKDAEINNDFEVSGQTGDKESLLRGVVGNGGGEVTLNTTHADISLHKGAVSGKAGAPGAVSQKSGQEAEPPQSDKGGSQVQPRGRRHGKGTVSPNPGQTVNF